MTAIQAVPPDDDSDDVAVTGLDSLTAAETALAERKSGQSIQTLASETYPRVGLMGALGWVYARRKDPKLSYDSYMSSRTYLDITRELGLTGDDDSTDDDEDGEAGAEGKDEPG